MFKKLFYHRAHKAQVMSEYAIMFFVVIGVVSAMSIYVRRALQARIHGARDLMTKSVANYYGGAYNGKRTKVFYEYEPYYVQTNSDSISSSDDEERLLAGGTTGIFTKNLNATNDVQTNSEQFPPWMAK